MITATFTIAGIRDTDDMMHLAGTIAAWMMQPGHEDSVLDGFEAHDENGEPV